MQQPVFPQQTQPTPPPTAENAPLTSYYVPRPPRPRLTSDRRDIILAAVLIVLAVLAVNLSLYGGFHLGFSLAFIGLLVCGGVYLRGRTTPTPYSLFCTIAALGSTGIFLWHNDGVIKFFTFTGMVMLVMLALVDSTGIGRRSKETLGCFADALHVLAGHPLSHLADTLPAIFRVQREGRTEKRRCGGVFVGLLCALPVLTVVVPLLVSADAAFEGLLQRTILDNLAELFISVLLGLCVFGLLYSRWFSLRHNLEIQKPLQTKAHRGVDSLAVNAFLAVIAGVYVLYLLSQLAYFFSAFAGILPENYTVAQYARRGFFEMCLLCAINLVLVAGSLAISRKKEGKTPLSTRLVGLFILLFSIGLVVVALSKMVLYINAFGMTRLRLFTSVFMAMLGLTLVFVIIRLFATTFPALRATVVAVALLGLATGYVDVDTVVAGYNVRAYQSGRLETVDTYTLSNLSAGAVPYLVELLDSEDPYMREMAIHDLHRKLYEYGTVMEDAFIPDPDVDWRHYNIDDARARSLLIEKAPYIIETYQEFYVAR